MVQAFDCAFGAPHDLSDLCVRQMVDKFQDDQLLSLRWKAAQHPQQVILLLRLHYFALGETARVGGEHTILQRDLFPAAVIAVPVGD